jgi:hypothetical protein
MMPHLGRPTFLLTSLLALLTLGLSLTVYTRSILDPGPAQDVEDLFRRALGDSLAGLPPFSVTRTALPLMTVESNRRRDSVPVEDPAFGWAVTAAGKDSAALRQWLSPTTLRWARRDRDSVHVVFVRLTRHPGCPLLSRLDAVLSGNGGREPHIVRVSTSCPAPSPGTDHPGRG